MSSNNLIEDNAGLPILWIIVPCYNEESVLPITAPLFLDELKKIISNKKASDQSRVLFVNDGSKDKTWQIISDLAKEDEHYIGISQSRNRGHQNALVAGLMESVDKCDVTISIDCDGQDDINAMEKMMDEYLSGSEVVYGVRSKRDKDTAFKKFTAEFFYKLINALGGEVVFNHADYRLMSSRVVEAFESFQEVNLFLRGMIPLVGFKSSNVYYERNERMAGDSHYPLRKMMHFALDGITSLSVKPISMIIALGCFVSFLGVVGIIWAIVMNFLGATVAGWASIVCIMCFLGGMQLLSIGIIGEYIGKIYLETKKRPRFIISERTWEPYKRKYKG